MVRETVSKKSNCPVIYSPAQLPGGAPYSMSSCLHTASSLAKTPLAAADMAAVKNTLTEAELLIFVVGNRIHVVPPGTARKTAVPGRDSQHIVLH